MKMSKDSILYQTNQGWKSVVMALAWLIAGVSVILHILSIFGKHFGMSQSVIIALMISSVAVGVLVSLSIRCPKCKGRWYLYMLKSPTTSTKERDFTKLKSCPLCGYQKNEKLS